MSCARILWILSLHLVLSSVLAFPEDIEQLSNYRDSYEETDDVMNATDKLRDKRALGLILSGLAQVFGYTVSPMQLAVLPNPSPTVSANGGMNQPAAAPAAQTPPNTGRQEQVPSSSAAPLPAAPELPAITPTPAPTMAAAPRQRETIRFTGVVNFGNGSSVLGHLQQFERIFHGSTTTTAAPPPMPMATQAPVTPVTPSLSSTASPGARMSSNGMSPILTPFQVKIPLPVSNVDLKLSYPRDQDPIPLRDDEMVVRKIANVENFSVQSKEIFDGKDVMQPPPPTMVTNPQLYVDREPVWKKQHEQRIAQLERAQEEHAEKLKGREYKKSQEKEVNDSGERSEETNNNQKMGTVKNDCNCKGKESEIYKSNFSSQEEEDSREKYNSTEKISKYPYIQNSKDSSETGNQGGGQQFQEYNPNGIRKPYKFGQLQPPKITQSNYTGTQSNHQLPISDYYDKNRPDQIRNSYGEVLDDDYFEKLSNPKANTYNTGKSDKNSYASKEQENSSAEESMEEDPFARLREEYGSNGPESKYEEYNLNENYNTGRSDRKVTRIPTTRLTGGRHYNAIPSRVLKAPDNFQSSNAADSSVEAEKLNRNLEFLKYSPNVAPVRFLYQPDERDNTHRKKPVLGGTNNLNDGLSKVSPSHVTSTVRTFPKLDDLMPKFGLSQPALPRNLHEDPQFPQNRLMPNTYPEPGGYGNQYGSLVGPTRASHQMQHVGPQSGYDYLGDKSSFESNLQVPLGPNSDYRDRVILHFGQPSTKDTPVDSNTSTEEVQDILKRYRHEAPEQKNGKTNLKVDASSIKNVRSESTFNQSPSKSNVSRVPRQRRVGLSNKESDLSRYRSKRYVKTDPKSKKAQNDPGANSKAPVKTTATEKSFYDPKSAHDFFGFSKNDYSFDNEENTADSSSPKSKNISEEEEEILGFIVPEPQPYSYDESISKFTDEPEIKPQNVKVREYSTKLATLKVRQEKQDSPNGPVRHIDYIRRL